MKRKILSLALLVTMLFGAVLMLTGCGNSENGNGGESSNDNNLVTEVDYDGELVQGAEFEYGQFTYRYKQRCIGRKKDGAFEWDDINEDGWGVVLTDKDSTDKIDSVLLSKIGGKPVLYANNSISYTKALEIDVSKFDTSNIIDMGWMFQGVDVDKIVGIEKLNTSKVTCMKSMFFGCTGTELDVSNFDTSNVDDMSAVFMDSKITKLIGFSKWDTSNASTLSSLFQDSEFEEIDLSGIDTSNARILTYMFDGTKVKSLDLSKFDTHRTERFDCMFQNIENMEELDLSNFDFSNRDDRYMMYIFANSKIKRIYVKDEETKKLLEAVDEKTGRYSKTPSGAEFIIK